VRISLQLHHRLLQSLNPVHPVHPVNPVRDIVKQKALRIAGGLVLPVVARARELPSSIHAQDSRFNNEAANRNNRDGNAERLHGCGC
jgi:hypothetical protein